eukprot:gene21652-24551_t
MSRINLYKAPSAAHIVMFIAGSMFTAGIIHGSLLSSGSKPHTMSVKWQKATDEYMKFHKMNPIF